MKSDIIKFSDFINNFIKESKEEDELKNEEKNIDEDEDEEELKDELEEKNIDEEQDEEQDEVDENQNKIEDSQDKIENNFSNKVDFGINKVEDNVGQKELKYDSKEEDNKQEDNSDFYKLYKDKNENFSCDISIEGADSSDAQVRLLIESDEWNLIFNGEISNGKCNIPLKKLSIFNEGNKGIIKLEVITEGNIFIPWESEFIIKVSKKVMVSFNNTTNKKDNIKDKNKVQVKVNKN